VKDIQIGVQAKLKDNLEVLAQTISFYGPAPDLRAVLVPRASKEFLTVARALKIFVIIGASLEWNYITAKGRWVKEIETDLDKYNKKYLTNSEKKCWVPEVEINVPAGVKSPKVITEWKIKAVKLCIKLNQRGYLTAKDFKEAKVSMVIWKIKWLISNGKKDGKLTRYVKNPNATRPDELYPEIVEAIQGSNRKGNKE